MPTDWSQWTEASIGADKGLEIIDGLMEFASNSRGQPSLKERSLYTSAIVFAYAVWENYVEEAAIELVTALAEDLEPDQMTRPHVRNLIEKDATAWELSVHPGWTDLWVRRVTGHARGNEGGGWGLNTANYANSRALFADVGINPIPKDAKDELQNLIELRGEIVHTASTSTKVLKKEVGKWKVFVHDLYEAVDVEARRQCKNWLTSSDGQVPDDEV